MAVRRHTWAVCFLVYAVVVATNVSSSSRSTSRSCKKLKNLLPTWEYNQNRVIHKLAKYCEIEGDFMLNLEDIIGSEEGNATFIDIDIYLKCSSTKSKFGFVTPSFQYREAWLTTIRAENCNLTWETLSLVGRYVFLHHVFFVIKETIWDLNPSNASFTQGLGNISELQYHIEGQTFQRPIKLEELLPREFKSASLANLVIHCFNSSDVARPLCDQDLVTYNGSNLPFMFPELQGLYLQGAYSSSSHSQPFPWSSGAIKLPFNIRRTKSEQDQYTNGISGSTERDEFRRLLSVNRLYFINVNYFCNLKGKISRIDLHSANASRIPEKCFHLVTGLTVIDLSYNGLTHLFNDTFKGLHDLQQLYLNGNKITSYHMFHLRLDDLVNLKLLDISWNQLKKTKKGLFKDLISLETCNMEYNPLTDVVPETFPYLSTNLTFLNFRNSQLSTIPRDCMRFPMLKKCDCDYNNITLNDFYQVVKDFNPFYTYLWDPLAYYGEQLSYFSEGYSHDSDQTEISLQNNPITHILFNDTKWQRDIREKLAALLGFAQLNLGKGASLICDKSLLLFRNFLNDEAPYLLLKARLLHTKFFSTMNFEAWSCHTYRILGGHEVSMLHAGNESFLDIFDLDGSCPENCSCFHDTFEAAIFVDCYNGSLNEVPRNLPSIHNAYYLVSLESNAISELPDCHLPDYRWLATVHHLSLSGNHLKDDNPFMLEKFLSCMVNLQYIDLSGTQIQHIPSSVQFLNLTGIKLSGNRIVCCGAFWLKGWLQKMSKAPSLRDSDINDVYCAQPASSGCQLFLNTNFSKSVISVLHNPFVNQHFVLLEHSIIQLEPKDFICSQTLTYAVWAVYTTLFLMVSAGFGYLYKDDLQIKLFTLFSLRLLDPKEDNLDCLYDAYVMYCDKDFAWGQKTLLYGLEYLGFKVYDKNRDTDFTDLGCQIEDALSKSLRVIVVLSPNFLEDPTSLNEFERVIAHSKNRLRGRFVILVTLYPPNKRIVLQPTDQHMPIIMYLKHRCFVDVHSKTFWKEMLFWLPKQKLPDSTANISYTQSADFNQQADL